MVSTDFFTEQRRLFPDMLRLQQQSYDELSSILTQNPNISRELLAKLADQNVQYKIVPRLEDAIPELFDNDIFIVAGAYFGDEGKGKLVDALAHDPRITFAARLNSGENAGHSVVRKILSKNPAGETIETKRSVVFNLTPSGIMVPHMTNFIGPECVMDPINYNIKEITNLLDIGVDYKEKLFVGNVHIVGPHHKLLDCALSSNNGSTMTGMSYAHGAKVEKRGLRLDDIFSWNDNSVKRLKKDLNVYFALLHEAKIEEAKIFEELTEMSKKRKMPEHLFDFLTAGNSIDQKIDFLISAYQKYVVEDDRFPQRANVTHEIRKRLARGEKGIFEASQSGWLSNGVEPDWESTTSAQTHAAGVLASANINTNRYSAIVLNVQKDPADSRVGAGENPAGFAPQNYFADRQVSRLEDLANSCTDFNSIQLAFYDAVDENGLLSANTYTDSTGTYLVGEAMAISGSREFNEKGATTGKPRVIGLYDCLKAYQMNELQGPHLSISALDRGDQLDNVGLIVGHIIHNPGKTVTSNGKTYNHGDVIRIGDEYPCSNVLKYCKPLIKVMAGWKDTPLEKTIMETGELPQNVAAYIAEIEARTGFTINSFGIGPRNDQIVYIKRM